MTAPAAADAAALAAEAWALIGAVPRRAQQLAAEALRTAETGEVRSLAHRALGMALLEVGDVDSSVEQLLLSVVEAQRTDDPGLQAEAEMALALALQHRGDAREAMRHADRAVAAAPEVPRLSLQRAVILERFARVEDAIEAYRAAETLAREQDDPLTLARVWCNRGVLWIYQADLAAARTDLLAAEALCAELDLGHMLGLVVANLGYLAARQGDLVEALRRLEQVAPQMEAGGGLRHGIHELDRCEVLLLAGLPRDAVAAGRVAITALSGAGMGVELAEAKVITAQAALRHGDPDLALALAEDALAAFRRRRTAPWEALAREVMVRAQWQTGPRDARLMERARRVADALDAARWSASAASARIVSARLALELGHRVRARNELRRINAGRGAPVGLRIQARHAEALLSLAEGDERGAKTKLRAGWKILEEHRATLGATELRVGAAMHAAEIASLGLKLATDSGSPRQVFDWAERVRAGALHQPAAHAPRDERLATALGELRVVAAEADALAKEGGDPQPALRRQAALEEAVRRRAQILPQSEGGATASVDATRLLGTVGDHALVEYVEVGGSLAAVVAAGGRLTMRWLGSSEEAEREILGLRMALRRMALGSPVPALAVAAQSAARYSVERLGEQLLAPLADLVDGRPLAIVPTGSLHSLPWSILVEPGRAIVVAPSATLWLRGHEAEVAERGAPSEPMVGKGAERTVEPSVLLVAGPRLAEADAEIRDIAALYSGAEVLTSGRSTIAGVRDGLATADIAHLACHGRFRDDNALFSSLELADGALSVFEFDDLPQVPSRLILSACDAGHSEVHPGDELLGLTAALLRLGTRSLVASTLPVPDAASRRLMTAFHASLRAGRGVAEALGDARATTDPDRHDEYVAAAAFTVFGSG